MVPRAPRAVWPPSSEGGAPCDRAARERRPRHGAGFVYYDWWIVFVVAAVVFWVLVPAVVRGVGAERRRRALRADVARIADVEQAFYEQHHRYGDTLRLSLRPGTRLVSLEAGDDSWAAVVTNDSLSRGPKTCGLFVGPTAPPSIPSGTVAGQIACW
jgi:hypothetical protein